MPIESSNQLALLGGMPLLSPGMFPRDRADSSKKIVSRVTEILASGCWSMFTSPEVNAFEQAFSSYVGTKYSVLVNSCTCSLFAAILALELPEKAKIAVPAYTYIGTVLPVLMAQAEPVFVDIEPKTQAISIEGLERAFREKSINAVICALLFGKVDSIYIDKIAALCRKYKVKLIFDCAQFLGARSFTEAVAEHGTCCFSFGESKILRIGEGGAVSTNSLEIAEKVRLVRHEGEKWLNHNSSRISGWKPSPQDVIDGLASTQHGLNFRPLAIAASIGSAKLEDLPLLLEKTRGNASVLTKGLNALKEFSLPGKEVKSWWTYPFSIKNRCVQRDVLLAALLAEGIPVGVHFPRLIPDHPVFNRFHKDEEYALFAEAFDFANSHLVLPIYPALEIKHMNKIVKGVKKVIECNQLYLPKTVQTAKRYLKESAIDELNSGLYIFLDPKKKVGKNDEI